MAMELTLSIPPVPSAAEYTCFSFLESVFIENGMSPRTLNNHQFYLSCLTGQGRSVKETYIIQ